MRVRVLGLVLVLAGGACAADESGMQRHFDDDYQQATVFSRNGRAEECRAMLLALRPTLLSMSPDAQGKRAARLVRALASVGESQSARSLRESLVEQRRDAARVRAAESRQRPPEDEARDLFQGARSVRMEPSMRQSMMRNVASLLEKVPAPSAEALLERGICRIDAGQLDGAEKDLTEARKQLPKSVHPIYALARLARERGDAAGSASLLAQGLAQEVTAEGLVLLVRELEAQQAAGKAADAETRARSVIAQAGTCDGVELLWMFVGKLNDAAGRVDQAFEAYAQAASLWRAGPATPEALRLGRQLAKRGAADRQIVSKSIESLIPADSDTPAEHLQFAGDLARDDGDLAKALGYYGAGLKGRDPATFRTALEALRPAVQAKAQPELTQQLETLLKPEPPVVAAASPSPDASPAPGASPAAAASPAPDPSVAPGTVADAAAAQQPPALPQIPGLTGARNTALDRLRLQNGGGVRRR